MGPSIWESFKALLEQIWGLMLPLILALYDEKDVALTVALSLVGMAALLAWSYWGKIFIVWGPKVDTAISRFGILVSLPFMVIFYIWLFWQVLGLVWGLIPAPFGVEWIKEGFRWLIVAAVPVILLVVAVKALLSPIKSTWRALLFIKKLVDKVLAYIKKGWNNSRMAPVFTAFGALGLNFMVNNREWSHKEVYFWPSIICFVIGLVSVILRVRSGPPAEIPQATEASTAEDAETDAILAQIMAQQGQQVQPGQADPNDPFVRGPGLPEPTGCPQCGAVNKLDSRFCAECGRSLVVVIGRTGVPVARPVTRPAPTEPVVAQPAPPAKPKPTTRASRTRGKKGRRTSARVSKLV